MRVRILFQITDDAGASGAAEEIAVFEKATERPEDLGLLITEGKTLLAADPHPRFRWYAQAAVRALASGAGGASYQR